MSIPLKILAVDDSPSIAQSIRFIITSNARHVCDRKEDEVFDGSAIHVGDALKPRLQLGVALQPEPSGCFHIMLAIIFRNR